jgi:uncharacterized protein
MAEEEFLCIRCSRHMKTCCQTCEVYATPGDVERIAAHTGLSDFHEVREAGKASYLEQDDDPAWTQFVFHGGTSRRILKKQENGDCLFLGLHGCRLPLEVRPLICRIYPYSYNEHGIKDELAEGCPLELLRPGQGLIQALDMNRLDAERWHKQLYQEIRRETQDDEHRSDL